VPVKTLLIGLALALALTPAIAHAAGLSKSDVASSVRVRQCQDWIRARLYHSREPARMIIMSPDVACFDGEIEKDTVKPLLEWLSEFISHKMRPVLVVRSGGGDAAAGIDAMDELQSTDAAVHVVDLCASSCADYFFAGAKHRSVADGALLLFHGGYSKTMRQTAIAELEKLRKSEAQSPKFDWDNARRSLLADFDRKMARQDALYQNIGVSRAIVHGIDRIDADRLGDAYCDATRSVARAFLFFTVPQLAALGVQIQRGRPASDPREVNDKIRRMGAAFEACALPRSAFDRLRRG